MIGRKIRRLRREKGMTQEELGKMVGASKQTIYKYETGEVKSIPYKKIIAIADALNVTPGTLMGWEDKPVPQTFRIPVLGSVPAGVPVEAVEDIIGYEEIPTNWDSKGEFFALRINGESMFPAICDGDIVIVRKTPEVCNDDIVIAMINGYDSTCKRYRRNEDGIMLIPNNEAFAPMFYTHKKIKDLPVYILGKVVELRRKFKD